MTNKTKEFCKASLIENLELATQQIHDKGVEGIKIANLDLLADARGFDEVLPLLEEIQALQPSATMEVVQDMAKSAYLEAMERLNG